MRVELSAVRLELQLIQNQVYSSSSGGGGVRSQSCESKEAAAAEAFSFSELIRLPVLYCGRNRGSVASFCKQIL